MEDIWLITALHEKFVHLLIVLSLCSVRIGIILMVLPATSHNALQGSIRSAITLSFGTFVAYGQSVNTQSISGLLFPIILGKEAILGSALGFFASTIFWVAEGAGALIDNLSGFNNIQVSNPTRSDTSTPISSLLDQLTRTTFWVLGGMTFLLGAIYQSFEWWPILSLQPELVKILGAFLLRQTDTLMQMTVKIATPMMLILLMVDFAFGFLSKGADKLDTMSLSMPVKGGVTLLLLAVFTSIFLEQLKGELALSHIDARFRALSSYAQKHLSQ